MRRAVHFLLVMLGTIPWSVGYFSFVVAIGIARLCDRVWPNATHGNCWSFTLPRWSRQGGYLILRESAGVRMFKRLIVPHALWARSIDPLDLEQTIPLRRASPMWIPWQVVYFHFRVSKQERDHHAKEGV